MSKQIIYMGGNEVVEKIGMYINRDKFYEITVKEIGDVNLSAEDFKEIYKQINEATKEKND